jgi:hypothetical protein
MENTFVIWFTKQLEVIKHGDVSSYFSNLSLPSVLSDPWWNGIVLYWFIKYKNNFKILLKKKKTSLYSTWQNNQLVDGGH